MYYRIKNFLKGLFSPSKIFLISDLHLDHKNIIRYCHRPFRNVEEMNKTIVDNWNKTVRRKDFVIFLGDMSFGRGCRPANYWLKKLKGRIFYIRGSHDIFDNSFIRFGINFVKPFAMNNREKVLFIHDPNRVKKGFKGWVIHGHKHNNDLKNFPFINGKRKTINVSVELIKYKPLLLDDLFKLHINRIRRMNKINSKPVYFKTFRRK